MGEEEDRHGNIDTFVRQRASEEKPSSPCTANAMLEHSKA
jgi:hypothetical protein